MNANIFFKAESLQRTGSFKIRGAYNFLYNLKNKYRKNGVLAWSSGNHAQGVAEAAKLFNIKATIIMPKDAPKNKIEGTLTRGAKIIFYDRIRENREEIGKRISIENSLQVIPPYDHPYIIYGQGTIALEIEKQISKLNLTPDNILVPTSGGGLIAGISTYIKKNHKSSKIYSVEPKDFADHAKSLKAGKIIKNTENYNSICDALLVQQPGKLTFSINRKLLYSGLKVEDKEVIKAMKYAINKLGLILEPGGAVALAALLENKIKCNGKTIVAVLSGSNVDISYIKKLF